MVVKNKVMFYKLYKDFNIDGKGIKPASLVKIIRLFNKSVKSKFINSNLINIQRKISLRNSKIIY